MQKESLASANALAHATDEATVTLVVPPQRVGKLIGVRGAVIQGLRQGMGREWGVTVDLQKGDSGAATITLRGPAEGARLLHAEIDRIVSSESRLEPRAARGRARDAPSAAFGAHSVVDGDD